MPGDYEYLYMIRQNHTEALTTLMNNYKGLIWKRTHVFWRMYSPQGIGIDDVFQNASLGFIEAIYMYKESMDVGLAHFIAICIDSHIQSSLRKCRGKSYTLLDSKRSLDMTINEDASLFLSDILIEKDVRKDPQFMSHYYEALSDLNRILDGMSEVERTVYNLREAGYSYVEISELLNISKKQIDNTLQKVRRLVHKSSEYSKK